MEDSIRTVRVGVLVSSYEGSDSDLKEFEAQFEATPAHYFMPRCADNGGAEGQPTEAEEVRYTFKALPLVKKSVYRDLRAIVKSGDYDVYFNLCDGARDEDRAGEEVVRALEEFQVPFTGATSKHYELSKPHMKMIAHYSSIPTAAFAVVEDPEMTAELCAHLRFPVIVKHISGYSSVGMTKDCKCPDMPALVARTAAFIKQYQSALVEEFIDGDEVTVLACADPSMPDGIRVYPPVMMRFPENEDFKHFHLKWEAYDGLEWFPVPADHAAYSQIETIGRRAFKSMMGGVGYGRTDIRVDRHTGEAVFLEVNPNCGIMYAPGEEGSADYILRFQQAHRSFAVLQMEAALARCESQRKAFDIAFDARRGGYYMRAARPLKRGTVVFADEGRPFRLFTKEYVNATWDEQDKEWFRSSAWPIGGNQHVYAIWDIEPDRWRPFNHSCAPSMRFVDGRSLNVETTYDVPAGAELTMDYATFCDGTMEPFACHCGAPCCRGTVSMSKVPPYVTGRSPPQTPCPKSAEADLPLGESPASRASSASASPSPHSSQGRTARFAVGPMC